MFAFVSKFVCVCVGGGWRVLRSTKIPKVHNRTLGEKSTNLVTLPLRCIPGCWSALCTERLDERGSWLGHHTRPERSIWNFGDCDVTAQIKVARFFSVQHTKTGKTYQMTICKIYQMTIKYTKCTQNIPNGRKIHMYTIFIARPSKIYPNWDFWFDNICTIWQPWLKWGMTFDSPHPPTKLNQGQL
jgi:hypothetical protein